MSKRIKQVNVQHFATLVQEIGYCISRFHGTVAGTGWRSFLIHLFIIRIHIWNIRTDYSATQIIYGFAYDT